MFQLHLKRVLIFGFIGLVLAGLWIVLTPKVYQANEALIVGASSRRPPDPSIPEEVGRIIDGAEAQQSVTEIDLLRGQGIFNQALLNVSSARGDASLIQDAKALYNMYAVLGGANTPGQSPDSVSGLAVLQVRSHNPQVSIDIANAIPRVYTEIRQHNLSDAYQKAQDYLNVQIAANQKQLKVLDDAFLKAKSKAGIVDLPLDAKQRLDFVSQLQSKEQALASDYQGASREVASLQASFNALPAFSPGGKTDVRNPSIEFIETQLASTLSERAAKATNYRDNTPEVRQYDDRIAALRAQLAEAQKQSSVSGSTSDTPNPTRESLKGQIAQSKSREASLKAQLAEVQTQLRAEQIKTDAMPGVEKDITQIERERTITDLKYRNLLTAQDEISNRVNTAQLPAVVVQTPTMQLTQEPVEPNVPRTVLLGLLGGIAIGLIFSFARESVKPIVISASQLEQATGLPVAATLPRLPGSDAQRIKAMMNGRRFPRKDFHDLASSVLADREGLPKTIVVCGVAPDSSSGMAAVSYAAALAKTGLRVTLVDANPSKTITRAFNLEAEDGIVDYLTQGALVSQTAMGRFSMLTKFNETLGCKICPFGKVDGTSITDFSDDRVAAIIEALMPDTDVLLIETAPTTVLPDAVRMARHADEVLATFSAGKSGDRAVDNLRDTFADAGVRKMSMVLTNTLERVA